MFFIKRCEISGWVLRSFLKSLPALVSIKIAKLLELTLKGLPLNGFAFFKAGPSFFDLLGESRSSFVASFNKEAFVFFDRDKDHGLIDSYRMTCQCICSHFLPPFKSITQRIKGVKGYENDGSPTPNWESDSHHSNK